MKKKIGFALIVLTLVMIVLPTVVAAQAPASITPKDVFGLPGTQTSTFSEQLGTYVRLFLTIVGLIAVVFLIIGGFRYIMSAGDSEAAEAAKNTIVNSIIGLVVIILSYVIVVVITRALISSDV